MAQKVQCAGCRDGKPFPIEFTMAFQPIVDASEGNVWAYEALVRGINGEGAGAVLSQVTEANRYAFDQACRVKAIELAGERLPADSQARVSINFLPNAVYEPMACIQSSLKAAYKVGFDPRRIMFEFTEDEQIADTNHLKRIIAAYQKIGFVTAIDDFGAGYSGLNLLAQFQPDIIKIDMALIRDIADSPPKQAIIAGLMSMAGQLEIEVIAEGIETEAEFDSLRHAGVRLFQGYWFSRPEVETFSVPAGYAS
ncbi:EAL domain-containing protein [Cucumibacter marinus]|uniref:EAL domain-containing protein n=1 Tax=Cucumibacter marinus TaxID=1121252 RepID=UPI0004265F39|nr:EAL domain-containing protein [Cucumibacter marinus]